MTENSILGRFRKSNFKIFFDHGEGMTMTENSKIRPFWSVLESQISKFSSTMVKVLLRQKTVKLGHSGAFQKVKFQIFLQPW